MMEQIHQQSNAEASPPSPCPAQADWSARNTGTGGSWQDAGAAQKVGGLVPCASRADWQQLLGSQGVWVCLQSGTWG